jgi:hypothetical protein
MKLIAIRALLVAGSFFAISVSQATAEAIKVFVLAGQSNMVGLANAADLPAPLRAPRTDVRFTCRTVQSNGDLVARVGEGWTTLRPGTGTSKGGEGFGPEIGFGNAIADAQAAASPPGHVAIIKFARSGANLFEMFHPDATQGLKLYPKMIAFVREQTRALQDAGHDVQIAGFIWYQGEADAAATEAQSKAFADNLKLLIARVRTDLGRADLPFVAVRVNPHAARHVHADVVRAAIQTVTESDGHAAWVNIDDLNQPDNLHLDAAGQLEAGKRLAAAWQKLTAANAPKVGSP